MPSQGSFYAAEGDQDGAAHQAAMSALIERFGSDYEETIHREAGEERGVMKDSDIEKTFKGDIKTLIKEYAAGNMDEATFKSGQQMMIDQLKKVKPDIIKDGEMYANNLAQVAEQVKQAVDHGASLDELDFDIVVGRAEHGVRTEAKHNMVG